MRTAAKTTTLPAETLAIDILNSCMPAFSTGDWIHPWSISAGSSHVVVTILPRRLRGDQEQAVSVKCAIWGNDYGVCRVTTGGHVETFHCSAYGDSWMVQTPEGYYESRITRESVVRLLRRLGSSMSRLTTELDNSGHSPDTDGLMSLLEAVFKLKFRARMVKGKWQMIAVPYENDPRFIRITWKDIPQGVWALLNESKSA